MTRNVCPGSPCKGCPKDIPGKSCFFAAPAGTVSGCAKWYDWAMQAWGDIHRQGMETIRKKKKLEE